MQVATETALGIVLTCDPQGLIVRVAYDGLGLSSRLIVGQPFAAAIGACGESGSTSDAAVAASFMEALQRTGFALAWDLRVLVTGRLMVLSFTGGATNDGVLIVGEAARSEARQVVEELMRINNETVNALRATMQQAASSEFSRNERDEQLLAELSRANNDVVTAQRELAQKNASLRDINRALEDARATLEVKQAALERANAQLDALATIDGLTGVKNRRAFDERLAEELSRSARSQTPVSLILLDVDHFKQYNDTFGHLAGDNVLKTVARLLQEHSRQTECVARYGGEEFTVVLPNTDAVEATAAAERLRHVLETAVWPGGPVTASFGIASLSPAITTSLALIGAADRALYVSKNTGRNRVTHVNELVVDPV
ncbi:MAG: diguanylate cyclase [Acidobacteriota bacterium]